MAYICPVCNEKYFSTEDAMRKHLLFCWKEHNPCHKSTPAPRKEKVVREVNDDIINFFSSFGGK